MNKEEIKQILLQNNLIVKKKYGQNFLLDEVVLNNIILKAGIKADSCVVDVYKRQLFTTMQQMMLI